MDLEIPVHKRGRVITQSQFPSSHLIVFGVCVCVRLCVYVSIQICASTPAAGAGDIAEEGEHKDDEGGIGEEMRRGERSREFFFSSTRTDAAAAPGANTCACGDIGVAMAAVATRVVAAAGTPPATVPSTTMFWS